MILAAITAIAITAITQYSNADEALKIWSALAGLLGVVTGAIGTYFFTRQDAEKASGLTKLAASLDPQQLAAAKGTDPLLNKLL